eukprot:TRINITY_DN11666_c0_g2_i1.p1 TRINITY_DN11666_c0_g2~~TRINITY_DN11666_c0_g2_i1.p1  ORF type:complete len:872 (+),score=159.40 TRINITY_DN11666_c0_g2_i1:177-2792(+)
MVCGGDDDGNLGQQKEERQILLNPFLEEVKEELSSLLLLRILKKLEEGDEDAFQLFEGEGDEHVVKIFITWLLYNLKDALFLQIISRFSDGHLRELARAFLNKYKSVLLPKGILKKIPQVREQEQAQVQILLLEELIATYFCCLEGTLIHYQKLLNRKQEGLNLPEFLFIPASKEQEVVGDFSFDWISHVPIVSALLSSKKGIRFLEKQLTDQINTIQNSFCLPLPSLLIDFVPFGEDQIFSSTSFACLWLFLCSPKEFHPFLPCKAKILALFLLHVLCRTSLEASVLLTGLNLVLDVMEFIFIQTHLANQINDGLINVLESLFNFFLFLGNKLQQSMEAHVLINTIIKWEPPLETPKPKKSIPSLFLLFDEVLSLLFCFYNRIYSKFGQETQFLPCISNEGSTIQPQQPNKNEAQQFNNDGFYTHSVSLHVTCSCLAIVKSIHFVLELLICSLSHSTSLQNTTLKTIVLWFGKSEMELIIQYTKCFSSCETSLDPVIFLVVEDLCTLLNPKKEIPIADWLVQENIPQTLLNEFIETYSTSFFSLLEVLLVALQSLKTPIETLIACLECNLGILENNVLSINESDQEYVKTYTITLQKILSSNQNHPDIVSLVIRILYALSKINFALEIILTFQSDLIDTLVLLLHNPEIPTGDFRKLNTMTFLDFIIPEGLKAQKSKELTLQLVKKHEIVVLATQMIVEQQDILTIDNHLNLILRVIAEDVHQSLLAFNTKWNLVSNLVNKVPSIIEVVGLDINIFGKLFKLILKGLNSTPEIRSCFLKNIANHRAVIALCHVVFTHPQIFQLKQLLMTVTTILYATTPHKPFSYFSKVKFKLHEAIETILQANVLTISEDKILLAKLKKLKSIILNLEL